MKLLTITLLFLLSGCTPYVFGGAGYAGDAGYTGFDEKGVHGVYGAGIRVKPQGWETRWYSAAIDCEYYHRSMIDKKPETVINDYQCVGRVYLLSGK